MKKILLIEDDTDLFALLKYNLEKEGFFPHRIADRKGGARTLPAGPPRPDPAGYHAARFRRSGHLQRHPQGSGAGFHPRHFPDRARLRDGPHRRPGVGANDYVVKPFFVRELIARIKLQLRGAPWTQAAPARVLEAGGVELDPSSRQVRLHGEPLSLTATEFRLLEFLMKPSRRSLQPRAIAQRRLGPGPRHHRPRRGRIRSPPAPKVEQDPANPS